MTSKCHVMHIVDALEVGGMENGVVNIANRIDKERFRLSICCLSHAGALSSRLDRDGVELITLGWSGGVTPGLFFRLARTFRERRVDIVHSHGWLTLLYSAVALLLAGRGVLINGEHGILHLNQIRRRLAYRALSRLVRRYVVVSHSIADEVAGIVRGAKGKTVTIPNGVDSRNFAPLPPQYAAALKRELGIPAEALVLGTVGRLEPVKNLEMLLRVFARLSRERSDLHCLLVGDGSLRDSLEQLAARLGVQGRVHFTGSVANPGQMLAVLDLFVCASLFEGTSNAVLEAMACGKPIVATDVGDNARLVVPGDNGFLVPLPQGAESGSAPCAGAGDAGQAESALERAMLTLLRDEALRLRFGRRSRALALERFDIGAMVRAYEATYLASLPGRSPILQQLPSQL